MLSVVFFFFFIYVKFTRNCAMGTLESSLRKPKECDMYYEAFCLTTYFLHHIAVLYVNFLFSCYMLFISELADFFLNKLVFQTYSLPQLEFVKKYLYMPLSLETETLTVKITQT